jgi:hypothetical protein
MLPGRTVAGEAFSDEFHDFIPQRTGKAGGVVVPGRAKAAEMKSSVANADFGNGIREPEGTLLQ